MTCFLALDVQALKGTQVKEIVELTAIAVDEKQDRILAAEEFHTHIKPQTVTELNEETKGNTAVTWTTLEKKGISFSKAFQDFDRWVQKMGSITESSVAVVVLSSKVEQNFRAEITRNGAFEPDWYRQLFNLDELYEEKLQVQGKATLTDKVEHLSIIRRSGYLREIRKRIKMSQDIRNFADLEFEGNIKSTVDRAFNMALIIQYFMRNGLIGDREDNGGEDQNGELTNEEKENEDGTTLPPIAPTGPMFGPKEEVTIEDFQDEADGKPAGRLICNKCDHPIHPSKQVEALSKAKQVDPVKLAEVHNNAATRAVQDAQRGYTRPAAARTKRVVGDPMPNGFQRVHD